MKMKMKAAKPPARGAGKPTKVKHDPRNLLTSLILVFPLFLIYQVGVLYTLPMLNGADFLTVFLFRNVGLTTSAYLGYTGIVAAAFVVGVLVLRRRQHFDSGLVWRVFIESAIYALTMGSLIVFVMTRVFGISPRLAGGVTDQGLVGRVVMSLGAGVYEETVFRLGILGGLTLLGERVLGLRRWIAMLIGLAISSVLFSAMHHIPPYGDPFTIGVFTFRILAGACFGLLYWFRGFAVAVYTHALYDLYVLIVR
jgi:hypothetical protein